ncbi:uncharacterized protein [Diadema antillarum]|uniref:uncharacterized protein n=1 Tax=Diadema antillarum TaxID=105358 RepID=UPI003A8AE426
MAMANVGEKKVLWSTRKIDKLVTLFKAHPCLYNRSLREYNDKELRMEALRSIAGAMQISCDDVYRKIVNLRSQFRREKHREVKLLNEGITDDPASLIKWVHYRQLKFLDEFVSLRNPRTDLPQYSPMNEFGDFDESIDDDLEYDCSAGEEYKVGQAPDTSTDNDLLLVDAHPCDGHDNGHLPVRGSHVTDGGTKRARTEVHPLSDHHQVCNRTGMQMPDKTDLDRSFSTTPPRVSLRGQRSNPSGEGSRGDGTSSWHSHSEEDAEDDDMIFARYIGRELRHLKDPNLKRLVKHQIQNLVFEAHCKTSPALSNQLPH